MSKSTISTFQLFDLFPDEEAARLWKDEISTPENPDVRASAFLEIE
jgi:hypothetical protein